MDKYIGVEITTILSTPINAIKAPIIQTTPAATLYLIFPFDASLKKIVPLK